MTTATIVDGMVFNHKEHRNKKQKLVVRFTSDELGETFSISDDKTVMLLIDFKGIDRFIESNRELNRWKESQNGRFDKTE